VRTSAKLGDVTVVRRWFLAAGIGLVSLLVILAGVYLLADDDVAPCSCSPPPSPTTSASRR